MLLSKRSDPVPASVSSNYKAWKDEANARFDSLKTNDVVVNRLLPTPSLCVPPCGRIYGTAIITASGCPCFVLRAAPFMFLLIASQLALAISFRFGARTPCCGHGLDHRRRQPHRRGGKLQQLNNQVHGRITSFRGRGRCQHTGLTPLTLIHYISNTQTFVLKCKDNRIFFQERRAA